MREALEQSDKRIAEYLAEWFADEVLASRTAYEFNPPNEFVSQVVQEMLRLGWTVETARADLADLWPDCKFLDGDRVDDA